MQRFSTMRAAALVAVCGALALAGCGGGGSSSQSPLLPVSGGTTQANNGKTTGTLSIVGLPATTSPSSTNRTSALPASSTRSTASASRTPQYLDTTTANSAVVVAVTPQDPAEAAQYGNLTVCYNLYTNGTLNAAIAAGSPPVVTIAFPAPPGTDGFQVTQYAGQCGSTPYTLPVEPAGTLNNGILSQTPVAFALLVAGTANAINAEVGACTQPVTTPAAGSSFACVGPGVGGAANLVATVAIAKVQFDTKVPITNPVREQGGFLTPGTKTIGIPIPLEGVNAAGTVVPGLTTALNPNGGAGPFPSGVTVTLAETTTPGGTAAAPTHAKLYLVDATNGLVAQAGTGANQSISITEFNVLAAADVTGGGGVAGHPWVLVLTYDGSGYAKVVSETVTATATTANAALPSPISLTITPQSAVYSAGGTGYVDTAAPAAPVGLLQPTAGGPIYVTDGSTVKIDGTATVSAPAAGTGLTGLAYATWPNATNFVYAVDSKQAGGSTGNTESPSGLYAFNPTTLASVPVSAAAGSGNFIQFPNPVGVVQATGPSGNAHPYLFVIAQGGGIYRVDISPSSETAPIGGFQEATNVLPIIATTGTPLSISSSTYYVGTAALAAGQFLVADPGNNRIAQVDATQNPAVITTYASGQPFVGFTFTGAAGASPAYATTTSGQVYYISAAGATPVSLGFSTSTTATDGPIGQITTLTGTNTLTPVVYQVQGTALSFFGTTSTPSGSNYATPYTVAPFAAAGPVFAAAASTIGLAADTSSGAATVAGTVNATGGILITPSTATAAATVTPGSILFTDIANKKLRTIVQ